MLNSVVIIQTKTKKTQLHQHIQDCLLFSPTYTLVASDRKSVMLRHRVRSLPSHPTSKLGNSVPSPLPSEIVFALDGLTEVRIAL